jgi:hypothetical protein
MIPRFWLEKKKKTYLEAQGIAAGDSETGGGPW